MGLDIDLGLIKNQLMQLNIQMRGRSASVPSLTPHTPEEDPQQDSSSLWLEHLGKMSFVWTDRKENPSNISCLTFSVINFELNIYVYQMIHHNHINLSYK